MLDPSSAILGVPALDDEHLQLLTLINRICSGEDAALLVPLLQRYAEEHFAVEETLMTTTRYPDREAHLLEHELYRRRFAGLVGDSLTGSPVFSKALLQFLEQWWGHHIQGVDRALAEHLKRARRLAA